MSRTFKLNMLFMDRIGIVADISRRVAEQGMNIVSMEVERRKEMADVYLEVELTPFPGLIEKPNAYHQNSNMLRHCLHQRLLDAWI